MKKILLLIVSLGSGLAANAQFAVGGSLGFNVFSSTPLSNFGLSAHAEYAGFSDKTTIVGNFSYFFPSWKDGSAIAKAKDAQTEPKNQSVSTRTKLPVTQVNIGARHYILGAYDDDLNVYAGACFGYMAGDETYEIDEKSYDHSLYQYTVSNYDPSIPGSVNHVGNYILGINGGVELETQRDRYFFADLLIFFPVSSINDDPVPVEITRGFQLKAGMKFNLK